ncbi:MAG TPA: hypothetical protein VMA36_21940, partial [Candidatus Limnocylindria bacterium]|nr:hypothetical protein [Candidatus Limnocylindria bacterium]
MTTFRRGFALLVALFVVLAAAYPRPALAGSDGGRNIINQSVYIPPGDVVDGDLNVIFGDAKVAGVVRGDCNSIFGSCEEVDGGQILGHQNGLNNEALRAMVPWVVGKELGIRGLADQDRRLFFKLAASAIVVLVFLLFPLRMRVALDRVERHPALSAATGAIAFVAVVPIAIVLAISIIGIPLIALEIAAVFAGVWIGTGALALLVGRRLCELVMPSATPSPLVALIIGLVVVCAAEIVPIVGWVVTALVWLVGLGAAILSFVR